MSRRVVAHVIHRLLTDEELRTRFAVNPIDTIAELSCLGFDLTPDEIEAFVRTDARLWCWSSTLVDHRLH